MTVAVVAQKNEHLSHVIDVLVPEFLRVVVLLRIVIPVGEAQPRLREMRDHIGALLFILVCKEREGSAGSHRLQVRDLGLKRARIPESLDPLKFFGEGSCPLRFDRGGVHAARIKISDHLLRASPGSGLILRSLVENVVEDRVILLLQFAETAP
jgi:hypothetical protein